MANLVVLSPFTLAMAGSSRFVSRVSDMNAVNQSIGWLLSLRHRLRKVVLGPPSTLGLTGIVGRHCRDGDCFLFFAVFLRFTDLPLGRTYNIFLVVPVNFTQTKVS